MTIIVSHDFLDDTLTWDRWKEYADKDNEIWDDEWRNNRLVRVQNMMQGSLELIESNAERLYPLRSDLNMVIGLIDYAKENRDYKALLDAHRIVHDIEHYTLHNGVPTREYFGATIMMERSYDNLMSGHRLL